MDANQVKNTVVTILHWTGLVLTVVVLARLLGANINIIPGSVDALALAAIACSVAR
jgi:hypothetical protein